MYGVVPWESRAEGHHAHVAGESMFTLEYDQYYIIGTFVFLVSISHCSPSSRTYFSLQSTGREVVQQYYSTALSVVKVVGLVL